MVKYLNTLRRYLNTSTSMWVFQQYLNTDTNCSLLVQSQSVCIYWPVNLEKYLNTVAEVFVTTL